MAKTKYVKVEMTLVISEDRILPVAEFLPNVIRQSLSWKDGEYILDYHDTEAEWDAKWGTEPVGETEDEPCRYCGGECPTQPDGDVCDYYSGDIDGLYGENTIGETADA